MTVQRDKWPDTYVTGAIMEVNELSDCVSVNDGRCDTPRILVLFLSDGVTLSLSLSLSLSLPLL